MNNNAVLSKIFLTLIIATLPFKTTFADNVNDDFVQHKELKAATNISGKQLNVARNDKKTDIRKIKTKEGTFKGSQLLLPLIFEKNVGQTEMKFDYLLRQQNYVMYFTENSFITSVTSPTNHKLLQKDKENQPSLLKMSLVNAKPRKPNGELPVKTKINQYIGSDEKKWLIDIPGYSQLHYKSVYKGIDMLWKSKNGFPEYQFNVAGNASESLIRIKFNSAAPLSIKKNNLIITLPNGTVFHSAPKFFEESVRGVKPLKGHYVLISKNEIGFKAFNRTPGKRLIIDPTVTVTARFVNATTSPFEGFWPVNIKKRFDIEHFGNALFVSGTSAGLQRRKGSNNPVNAFILRIPAPDPLTLPPPSNAGTRPEEPIGELSPPSFLTYFGGSQSELNALTSIGDDGKIYIGGTTESDDFPTPGTTFRDAASITGESTSDKQAYIAQFSHAGRLVLGTMIGKGSDHHINDIKFSEDSIYVAGTASYGATDINSDATNRALQKHVNGRTDGFIAKIDTDLADLDYFTYLGSEEERRSHVRGMDVIYGLDVFNDRAYVVGTTASGLYPTTDDAAQREFSIQNFASACEEEELIWQCFDGFITVLNSEGSAIDYSTFYGGEKVDLINDVSVNNQGEVAITGTQRGKFDPPATEVEPKHLFVAKLNPAGQFVFNKLFVNPPEEEGDSIGHAITTDDFGSIHVTGEVSRNGMAVGNANVDDVIRSAVLGESDMFHMFIPPRSTTGQPNSFTYFGSVGADIGQAVSTRINPTSGLACTDIVGYLNVNRSPSTLPAQLQPSDLGIYTLCITDDDLEPNIFGAIGSSFTKRAVRAGSNQTISSVAVGDDFDYVIEIFNASEFDGVVTVRDSIPQYLRIRGAVINDDGNCLIQGNEVSCNNVRVLAQLTTEIRIPVTAPEWVSTDPCIENFTNSAVLFIGEDNRFFTNLLTTNLVSCSSVPEPPDIVNVNEVCDNDKRVCEDGFVCALPALIPTVENCFIDILGIIKLFCDEPYSVGSLTARCLDEDEPNISPLPSRDQTVLP